MGRSKARVVQHFENGQEHKDHNKVLHSSGADLVHYMEVTRSIERGLGWRGDNKQGERDIYKSYHFYYSYDFLNSFREVEEQKKGVWLGSDRRADMALKRIRDGKVSHTAEVKRLEVGQCQEGLS